MRIIMNSGTYSVSKLGATRSIDVPLIKGLSEIEGLDVVWIGIDTYKIGDIKYINLVENFLFRQIHNVFSRLPLIHLFKLLYTIIYDLFVSTNLKYYNGCNDKTFFLTRLSMSAISMHKAKKLGIEPVLHASWNHYSYRKGVLTNIGGKHEYNRLRLLYETIEIRLASRIWCVSNYSKNSYLSYVKDFKRLFVVYPYFNDLSISSENNLQLSQGPLTILFVGQLNKEKGIDLLMEALDLLNDIPRMRIILHGAVPGNMADYFLDFKHKFRLKGHGLEFRSGSPEVSYKDADLFVLPSRHDSFGMVVTEAMSYGLPVVVSECVGASELVSGNGYVVKSENVLELSKAIRKYLKSRNLRVLHGNKSTEIMRKVKANEQVKLLIENLYEGLE